MGAEQMFFVEVEVCRTEVRVSYGVTKEDALQNVWVGPGERATGKVWTDDRQAATEWIEMSQKRGY